MKQELVPQVDKNDNLLGVVERADAYEQGLIHRGVHAFIKNEQGKILIQQRSDDKSTWAGRYDLSIAETLKPDESYQSAVLRGLREELDLIIPESQLLPVKEKYYQEYFWDQYKVFGMISLFSIESSKEPHFLDGEVKSIQWLSKEEISELVKDEEKCTPWLVSDWQFYLSMK